MSCLDELQFPEGTVSVSVKIDLSSISEDAWMELIMDRQMLIHCYLQDHDYGIMHFSSGIHKKGKNELPHCHIHYVVNYTGKGSPIHSNDSQRRSRFLKQILDDEFHPVRVLGIRPSMCSFQYTSFQFKVMDLKGNHYDTLAYPLKEGNRCSSMCYGGLSDEQIDALERYAVAIFEKEFAIEARRQKHDKKLTDRKSQMLNVANQYRSLITDFMSLQFVLSKYYAKPLPFLEKPRPMEFRNNCQIIAIELGVADYMDF